MSGVNSPQCSLCSVDSNTQFSWLMLIGCGTGDLGALSLFPALVLLFSHSLFFFIFSYKSRISHSACFPVYFQIKGSDDSLGGSGRALLPYPSPYLETANEKDLEENSLSYHSSVALNGDWRESEFLIKFSAEQKKHEGTNIWMKRRSADHGAGVSKTTGAAAQRS